MKQKRTKKIKKVNICGVEYKVKYVADHFQSDSIHFGEIDHKKARILIAKDMAGSGMEEETLCHEVIHGILMHIGREDLSCDETFVQSLSNGIFQGFKAREVS